MRVRERDAIDYLAVSVVTALVWLHVPSRFVVYARLHDWAWWLRRWADRSPDQAVAVAVVATAVVGGAFLAWIVRSASS